MRILSATIAGAFLALGAATLPAAADDDLCNAGAREGWMSVAAISERASAAGYEVREVEVDDGCYEIGSRDSSGRSVDVKMHPVTGEVVKVENES